MVISCMLTNAVIHVFDCSEPYSRDEEKRREFADGLGQCDFIFAQLNTFNHTSEHDLRARYGAKVVTIANFYFRGLFPDSCYVGAFGHRLDDPTLVNSVVVLDAFRRGLSEAAAVRSFTLETFIRLRLLGAWESSMAEMRWREADGAVDVPCAALIDEACRRYPAFLTMNHPSAALLTEYVARVFREIGIRHDFINPLNMPDPLAAHDTTPVFDFVADYFGLPYRTSQCWKINALQQRYIGVEDYVGAFYAAYRAVPRDKLVVHSPSDLVELYRTDRDLAYLLDVAAAPSETEGAAGVAPLPDGQNAGTGRFDLRNALRPTADAVQEVRIFTHRMHSFLEIADPKIERIAQALHKLDQLEREVQACNAGIASVLRSLERQSKPGRLGMRQRLVNRLSRLLRDVGLLFPLLRKHRVTGSLLTMKRVERGGR